MVLHTHVERMILRLEGVRPCSATHGTAMSRSVLCRHFYDIHPLLQRLPKPFIIYHVKLYIVIHCIIIVQHITVWFMIHMIHCEDLYQAKCIIVVLYNDNIVDSRFVDAIQRKASLLGLVLAGEDQAFAFHALFVCDVELIASIRHFFCQWL